MKINLLKLINNIALNFILLFFHIPYFRNIVLSKMGLKIPRNSYIGLCIVLNSNLIIDQNSKIKSFNLFNKIKLHLESNCTIGRFNFFLSDFIVNISENGHIGNFCIFRRSKNRSSAEDVSLVLGEYSNITSSHYFDLSSNILIGMNSVIGGRNSQFWSHGFSHSNKGLIRNEIVNTILIGNGVYIGSSCIINPGTKIHDDINIGSGCVLAGELKEPGLYVNQKLRFIKPKGFNNLYDGLP